MNKETLKKYAVRLLRIGVILTAIALFGWIVNLAFAAEATPWPLKAFLMGTWLFMSYLAILMFWE